MARVILMGHMSLLFDDCCHYDPIRKNYGLRELSCARPHGVTIIIPAARVSDLAQLCDSGALCRNRN